MGDGGLQSGTKNGRRIGGVDRFASKLRMITMLIGGSVFLLVSIATARNDLMAREALMDCADMRGDTANCLACNIYHEARDQSDDGQFAVAMVTLNRLRSSNFPDSVCEVVWQQGRDSRTGAMVAQFSWTLDGRPDVIEDWRAWTKAHAIAAQALEVLQTDRAAANEPDIDDPSYGALFYHNDQVDPYWREAMRELIRIDNHIFYTHGDEYAVAARPRAYPSRAPSTATPAALRTVRMASDRSSWETVSVHLPRSDRRIVFKIRRD